MICQLIIQLQAIADYPPRTLSFMSRSLTMKLATMDFIGDAN